MHSEYEEDGSDSEDVDDVGDEMDATKVDRDIDSRV